MNKNMDKNKKIDWLIIILPLLIILILFLVFMVFPKQSEIVIEIMRRIFAGKLGFHYILFGIGMLVIMFVLALSSYGEIVLGNKGDKPKYNNFEWGAMIFTSTMAADILYWSLIEWAYYFNSNPFGNANLDLVQRHDFAASYPLFHWGPIPWSFYLLPAVAYGYMFFVRNKSRQTLSEACRPVIGGRSDEVLGKVIDVFSIVGLLMGIATTFSLATPLLSLALSKTFGITESWKFTIIILILIAVIYTITVLTGLKGISKLANLCTILFITLLVIFFIAGPKIYIIETGITGIGKMINDFFSMATWMDPLRLSGAGGWGFPQSWTVFYWAYWISWSVATPFFIGKISEGRTIRQTILGGMFFGLLGTYMSFIILGNYGLFQQVTGRLSVSEMLANGVLPSVVIVNIIETLPMSKVILCLLSITMVGLYASTFDAITLVISEYSMKNLKQNEETPKKIRIYWSFVLIILPISLIFNKSTLNMLQTLSIVAAFPLSIVIILVIYGFLKDLFNKN